VSRAAIIALLESSGQSLWATRVRSSALMTLLNHIGAALRKSHATKAHGVPCSNRLARSYCSPLRNPPGGVEAEPLAVLVRAGLLEIAAPAKVDFYSKLSARYRLAPAYQKMTIAALDEHSTDCIKRKLADAPARLAKGLNRRWPYREQLLRDLTLITVSESARDIVDALLAKPAKRPATRAVIHAISTREHTVRVKASGLIVTSMISCPRELKPHLLIAGEPAALCDISSAHWMFLPRILMNRIEYCRRRGDSEEGLETMNDELKRLIALCSSGSFYKTMCRVSASVQEIKTKKFLANVLLNSPNSKAARNVIWRGLHRRFPHCLQIIDTIKRGDHRSISRQLQHFTAQAIGTALLDMQSQRLPAIPDTDCLIVRERDREAACLAIGRAMYAETRGVCVTVGGIHYKTPAYSSRHTPMKDHAPHLAIIGIESTRPLQDSFAPSNSSI
jgi:hypothetical protein